MCIFNASSIRFTVDALFGYFAYLHNLYTAVELYTNLILIYFGSQPLTSNKQTHYLLDCGSGLNKFFLFCFEFIHLGTLTCSSYQISMFQEISDDISRNGDDIRVQNRNRKLQ